MNVGSIPAEKRHPVQKTAMLPKMCSPELGKKSIKEEEKPILNIPDSIQYIHPDDSHIWCYMGVYVVMLYGCLVLFAPRKVGGCPYGYYMGVTWGPYKKPIRILDGCHIQFFLLRQYYRPMGPWFSILNTHLSILAVGFNNSANTSLLLHSITYLWTIKMTNNFSVK